jgi:hypothetical protein
MEACSLNYVDTNNQKINICCFDKGLLRIYVATKNKKKKYIFLYQSHIIIIIVTVSSNAFTQSLHACKRLSDLLEGLLETATASPIQTGAAIMALFPFCRQFM